MKVINTDVLVVGAGPAGLTAAALLARSAIPSITVTKFGGTANAPRAHVTNMRAMEILRDLGIEDKIKARALPQELMGNQVFATSFSGKEFARMMTWGEGHDRKGEYKDSSPSAMCNIAQHTLEPIMLEAAKGFGADIRFNHEAIEIKQDEKGVTATIRQRKTGETYQIRAKYVIGCDGAKTLVGSQFEFDFQGKHGLGDAITVWIEADLSQYTQHRSGALFFVLTPGSKDILSIWTCVEPWNEWSTIFALDDQLKGEITEESVMERIRMAIGDPSIEVKIKKISDWSINHVWANQYRNGRAFIAGDAAHRHPPAGGLGSNTSIQDAYNLVWKLALVLKGQADESLLNSYNDERQPVGRAMVDRANRNIVEVFPFLGALGLEPGQTKAEGEAILEELLGGSELGSQRRGEMMEAMELMNHQFNALGFELGQRYQSTAVMNDGQPFPKYAEDPALHYQQTTHPGAHIPHVWLQSGTQYTSTLDLVSYDSFTLIVGAGGDDWIQAVNVVRKELPINLKVVKVGMGQDQYCDVLGHWAKRREVGDGGCVLVRPDRFVAWRCDKKSKNPNSDLLIAMKSILGL